MHINKDQQKRMIDYDQLAGEYALHRKVQPEVFGQLVSTAEIRPGTHVLEIGCGTGNYISAIQAVTGAACWGIDPSFQMLARARENAPGVNFQAGCGEQIGFPDRFFDLVFSVDVIHHMREPVRYFREAFRVLVPGGSICTVTESSWMIRHRQPFSVYFPETVSADLQRYPTVKMLKDMLEFTSFTHIRSKVMKFSFFHPDIQDFRDKAYSCLHLISEEGFDRGIAKMEEDLKKSPIPWISRYLLLWGRKERDRKG